jgi:hypothetical protein
VAQHFPVIFGLRKTEITRSKAVSVEDFIITVYCLVDAELKKVIGENRLV